MIKIIPAKERHASDFGWLKTYWLFSFSNYYDPENVQFGSLRVFNDDIVEPWTGFSTHPHREMEIITIVLKGEITHEDSMGNKTVIKAGDVQRMSAGTGLTHSEYNYANEAVHFYQIWIYPDKRGLTPSYEQKSFSPSSWKNSLFPVASGREIHDTVRFFSDATIYRADIDRDEEISFSTEDYRRIFLYLTGGSLEVKGEKLDREEQARIDPVKELTLKALEDCSLILIDLPTSIGFGYDEKTLGITGSIKDPGRGR